MKLFKTLSSRGKKLVTVAPDEEGYTLAGVKPSETNVPRSFRFLALSDSVVNCPPGTDTPSSRRQKRGRKYFAGGNESNLQKQVAKGNHGRRLASQLEFLKKRVDINLVFFLQQIHAIPGLSETDSTALTQAANSVLHLHLGELNAARIQAVLATLEHSTSTRNLDSYKHSVCPVASRTKRYLMSLLAPLEPILVQLAGGKAQTFRSKPSTDNEGDLVVCRICEALVERKVLQIHSSYCSTSQEYHRDIALSDNALEEAEHNVAAFVAEMQQLVKDSNEANDTANSSKLITKVALKLSKICTSLATVAKVAKEVALDTGSTTFQYSGQSTKVLLRGLGKQLEDLADVCRMEDTDTESGKRVTDIVNRGRKMFEEVNRSVLDRISLVQCSIDAAKGLLVLDSASASGSCETPKSLLHSKSMRLRSVTINDFVLLKYLSKGGYARVYLARKQQTNDLFAVKVLSKQDMKMRNEVSHVSNERHILSSISNRYIVQLFFTFQSKCHLFFVFEFLPGGDLQMMLDEVGRFDSNTARFYASELVLAIEFLHSTGVVHRDLKPSNIMVATDGHIKLADFGLSKQSSVGGTNEEEARKESKNLVAGLAQSTPGTVGYCAPEVISGLEHGQAVDLWGLGTVIFQFLTGVLPMRSENQADSYTKVLNLEIDWPTDAEFEFDGKETRTELSLLQDTFAGKLITRLLVHQSDRPSIASIKQDEYFAIVDWDKQHTIPPPFVPEQCTDDDTTYFPQPLSMAECANQLELADEVHEIHFRKVEHDTILENRNASDTVSNENTVEPARTVSKGDDNILNEKELMSGSDKDVVKLPQSQYSAIGGKSRGTFAGFEVTMVNGLSMRNFQIDEKDPSQQCNIVEEEDESENTNLQTGSECSDNDDEINDMHDLNWSTPSPRIQSTGILPSEFRTKQLSM